MSDYACARAPQPSAANWQPSCKPTRPSLQPLLHAQALAPKLLTVAQAEYDQWDETDVDTYAGGGICHLIADAMVGVLCDAGIDCSSVSCTFEQHVYVVCKLAEGVYRLDIPYSLYERGGGFSWTKIQGVVFDSRYLDWHQIDRNPALFEEYLD